MYLPNELWKEIIMMNSLHDARLMNKQICFLCQRMFVEKMHIISENHIREYYDTCHPVGFNSGNALIQDDRGQYIRLNVLIANGSKYSYTVDGHKIGRTISIYKLLKLNIDYISIYHILKDRDIYQHGFAKNYVLVLLEKNKHILHDEYGYDIIRSNFWLQLNLHLLGLCPNIQRLYAPSEVLKEHNFILYQKLVDAMTLLS